jgi:hypothetical protein
MWSTARAVRVAVTTTSGEYCGSPVSGAELLETSAGSAAAEKAGGAAKSPTTSVPAAVNTKRSFNDVIT